MNYLLLLLLLSFISLLFLFFTDKPKSEQFTDTPIVDDTTSFKTLLEPFNKIQITGDFPWIYQPQDVTITCTDQLVLFLTDFLNNQVFKDYKQLKIIVSKPFYNTYYYDLADYTRRFSFETIVQVFNPTGEGQLLAFSSRRLLVVVDLTTTEKVKIVDPFTNKVNIDSWIVQYIALNDTQKVIANDPLEWVKPGNSIDKYYQILNPLGLMDPFHTTGDFQRVTEQDKYEWNKKVAALTTPESIANEPGACFNIYAANGFKNKPDCINAGGTWDTPPKTDFDCPFYKSNNLGIAVGTDYCQMPPGVKQIGYKTFAQAS